MDFKIVALVNGNHVAEINNIQAHDADAVSVVQFRFAINPLKVQICPVRGIEVLQNRPTFFQNDSAMFSAHKSVLIADVIGFRIRSDFDFLNANQSVFPVSGKGIRLLKADNGNLLPSRGFHLQASAIQNVRLFELFPFQYHRALARTQCPPRVHTFQIQRQILIQREHILLNQNFQIVLSFFRKRHLPESLCAVDGKRHAHAAVLPSIKSVPNPLRP